jgi:poly(3-hydroxyoctanoate) depolymerase
LAWRIACPTLIVSGTDDPLIPEINARILQRAIKGSQLYLVQGGGHLMMLDSAYELAPVIMTFLDAQRLPVLIHEPT